MRALLDAQALLWYSQVALLPNHHNDPFDRVLIAQAMVEHRPIVTGDPMIRRYPVQIIW